jgi:hypothetical protein
MQLGQLIATIDTMKPNHYDKDLKTDWVNEIEFKIINQIYNRIKGNNKVYEPYKYDEDVEKDLTLPQQFNDVYLGYLAAKIDFMNAEYERYNNNVALFQAAFNDCAAWYKRSYNQKPSADITPL